MGHSFYIKYFTFIVNHSITDKISFVNNFFTIIVKKYMIISIILCSFGKNKPANNFAGLFFYFFSLSMIILLITLTPANSTPAITQMIHP